MATDQPVKMTATSNEDQGRASYKWLEADVHDTDRKAGEEPRNVFVSRSGARQGAAEKFNAMQRKARQLSATERDALTGDKHLNGNDQTSHMEPIR